MNTGIADLGPVRRRAEQRAWSWYDWANSAFYTTTLTVLFGPLMITVAGRAAGCADPDDTCKRTVDVLGLHLAAGSLPSYLTSFATIASAFILPIVGALVDRSSRKKLHMAWFAWSGAFFAALLFFLRGDNWQLAAVAVVLASVLAGCSLVSYYAIMVDICEEWERDAVSSRGWAFGYIGGGVLLLVNLAMVLGHDAIGLDQELAVRLSLLSAALWWAGFTIIPVVRLTDHPARNLEPVRGSLGRRTLLGASFGQLFSTVKELPRYPMTLTFLLAYLFYNDGIQTVIYSASIYGSKQLHLGESVLIAAIVLIQFVAFGGALFFGRIAARYGAYRCITWGCVGWMAIVVFAAFLPDRNVSLFLLAGVAIALVMGGTQALSRSFYSLFIPHGREGEYFALYNAAERGTSWFGTLVFGLTFQLTGNYRWSIVAIVIFFALGLVLLLRLDPRRGVEEAGNSVPAVI